MQPVRPPNTMKDRAIHPAISFRSSPPKRPARAKTISCRRGSHSQAYSSLPATALAEWATPRDQARGTWRARSRRTDDAARAASPPSVCPAQVFRRYVSATSRIIARLWTLRRRRTRHQLFGCCSPHMSRSKDHRCSQNVTRVCHPGPPARNRSSTPCRDARSPSPWCHSPSADQPAGHS